MGTDEGIRRLPFQGAPSLPRPPVVIKRAAGRPAALSKRPAT